jgi:hypothetical protein
MAAAEVISLPRMTKNPDRDYAIAEAVAAGQPVAQVAAAYNLKPPRVRSIAKENAWLVEIRDGRPVPEDLTVRAAVAIYDALGIWPTDGQAHMVAGARWTILRSPYGRRVVMDEIDGWLARAGVPTDAREDW